MLSKLFLISCIILMAFTLLVQNQTHAQPSAKPAAPAIALPSAEETISKTMANNFYKSCIAQRKPDLFDDLDIADNCACQASTLTKKMTVSDMRALQNFTSRPGKKALRKFIYDVAMPCMISPLQQSTYKSCQANYGQRQHLKNAIAACKCAGEEAVKYLIQIGGQIAEAQMLLYPEANKDPVEVLMRNVQFRGEIENRALKCVQNYSIY